MKKSLFTLLLLSSSLVIFAQSKWSPRAGFPDSGRYCGVSFSIGNYGYIGLGYHAQPNHLWLKDFWQFNPATNKWIQKANFPGKARFCPAFFAIGNKGYVVTGVDSDITGYSAECWQYNPATNKWTQKANFPGLPRGYAVGFAIGGKGYVGIGGEAYAKEQKDFYAYDTATNTWARIADFPGVSRINANAFSVNGKGYLCFGADSSLQQFYKDMWEYDAGSNIWTQKASYPGLAIYGAAGFVIANNIYIGTGQDSDLKVQQFFWKYNPTLDMWLKETNFPGISMLGCFSFAVGDTGYLGLGADSDIFCYKSFYRFLFDSTLGIENIYNNGKVVIYPNPASQYLFLDVSSIPTGQFTIQVIDILGKEVMNGIEDTSNGPIRLDVSSFSGGVYFVKILSNGVSYTNKFIKI